MLPVAPRDGSLRAKYAQEWEMQAVWRKEQQEAHTPMTCYQQGQVEYQSGQVNYLLRPAAVCCCCQLRFGTRVLVHDSSLRYGSCVVGVVASPHQPCAPGNPQTYRVSTSSPFEAM